MSGYSLTWRSGTGATEVFSYGRCLKAFVAVLLLIITPRSRQGHLGRSSRALGHTDMACGHVPRLRSFGRTPITACAPGRWGTSEASGSESCRRNNANCLDQLHFCMQILFTAPRRITLCLISCATMVITLCLMSCTQ